MGRKTKNKKQQYKNYGKISQRRMTARDGERGEEDDDDAAEMERLREVVRGGGGTPTVPAASAATGGGGGSNLKSSTDKPGVPTGHDDDPAELDRIRALLRESTDHLLRAGPVETATALGATEPTTKDGSLDGLDSFSSTKNPRKRKRPRTAPGETPPSGAPPNDPPRSKEDPVQLIDEALFERGDRKPQQHYYGAEHDSEENPLIVTSRKKKTKIASASAVELTTEERKQAARAKKAAAKKLALLEKRADQKKKRAELYHQLQRSSLPTTHMQLLQSSSSIGGRRTQKQQLSFLVKKERAGLELTDDERALLYREMKGGGDDGAAERNGAGRDWNDECAKSGRCTSSQSVPVVHPAESSSGIDPPSDTAAKINLTPDGAAANDVCNTEPSDTAPSASTAKAAAPSSYAATLMASLQLLKAKTTEALAMSSATPLEPSPASAEVEAEGPDHIANKNGTTVIKLPSQEKAKPYVPPEPVVLKTAAALGMACDPTASKRAPSGARGPKVITVQRPPEVQAARYDLPVATMEFEVMDAIRNHDVTILCSETGSGKSTQVPQFLYEYGYGSDDDGNGNGGRNGLLIGITQPRRVAAVSTAKRVAYEMGTGNGTTISSRSKKNDRGTGNEVAYQTRYESAGLGSRTRIKFMTDGLLLQEVQSDLLLRKYSVIVLDEAHERNLNTDVLIGLVSKSLVLRRQTAEEGSLPALKLVIMSATLRVEDFTSAQLFSAPPAVVRIPGRAFPVTIHHSKVTELDNYEDAAFQKICKMHRKLPAGGILVFLTSKQEIVRMVNRLRKALASDRRTPQELDKADSLTSSKSRDNGGIVRDMDDDEVDADLMLSKEEPGEDAPADDVPLDMELVQPVLILPLYSLLSTEEQAMVFQPPPEGHRLIVIATNVAETSITIPGISYVVDSGRQKCRNYHAATGMTSYDVMWISKASADQRAGRAGRTGPGHCYRLYSSSLYARHMDEFAMPEILTRPLEDVVLAMKAMNITNVTDFPFPTPLHPGQLQPALELLSNLGCVDTSKVHEGSSDDGVITRLGAAVAKLPLGVRHGKMLLVATQAGVLDYAVAMVAALSEQSPFLLSHGATEVRPPQDPEPDEDDNEKNTKRVPNRWSHRGGDVLAAVIATGAYAYAGRDAGGAAERLACQTFCTENGLNAAVMTRIHTLRRHIARLVHFRLSQGEGAAARTGRVLSSMPPPNKLHDQLLRQALLAGLLDNVAMLAPLGSFSGDGGSSSSYSLRTAYLACSGSYKEPLFLDRNSVLHSRDPRQLPKWVCYETLERKTLKKDGSPIAVMKRVTPIDPAWLGEVAAGSRLLTIGEPLEVPSPTYDADRDEVLCYMSTRFGRHNWDVPPVKRSLHQVLSERGASSSPHYAPGDEYRWFARFLLEGKVFRRLEPLRELLNDDPAVITSHKGSSSSSKKVVLLVSALETAGICSARALREHWANIDDKFLFKYLKAWVRTRPDGDGDDTNDDPARELQKLWISAVRECVDSLRSSAT